MKKIIASLFAATLLVSASSSFAARVQPACMSDLRANKPASTATDAEKQAWRDSWNACMQEARALNGK